MQTSNEPPGRKKQFLVSQWKLQNLARLKKSDPEKFAQQAEELRARFAKGKNS